MGGEDCFSGKTIPNVQDLNIQSHTSRSKLYKWSTKLKLFLKTLTFLQRMLKLAIRRFNDRSENIEQKLASSEFSIKFMETLQ